MRSEVQVLLDPPSLLRSKGRFLWGLSSAGRAPDLHSGGQEFDPPRLHHLSKENRFLSIFGNAEMSVLNRRQCATAHSLREYAASHPADFLRKSPKLTSYREKINQHCLIAPSVALISVGPLRRRFDLGCFLVPLWISRLKRTELSKSSTLTRIT